MSQLSKLIDAIFRAQQTVEAYKKLQERDE